MPLYKAGDLPKVNAMRYDKTQPDFYGVPVLHDSDVMFTTASQMGGKPGSCYTCSFQQSDLTCAFLGPSVKVSKVTGHADSGDPVEYWPCCDIHDYGKPQTGKPFYRENVSTPSQVGLIWINAPEVGQKFGGSNCGGVEGGDDCDHYMVESGEKWDNPQGVCRVLQHSVDAGDDCAAWHDDDILEFEDAQQLMGGKSVSDVKKGKLARSIIGRDDE